MNVRFFIPLCGLLLCSTTLMGCDPFRGGSGESTNDQLARHDQQIRSLLAQMGQTSNSMPGQAETWSQMQAVRQDLAQTKMRLDTLDGGEGGQLKEHISRLDTMVRKIGKQLGISTAELDMPMPAMSVPTESATASGTAAPIIRQPGGGIVVTGPASGTPAPVASTVSSTALYDAGIKSFDARDYGKAVENFKTFASQNPSHTLASNASFWQGESYFQMKQYQQAVLAYQDVLAKHQGSSKYQAAMLKQGIALHSLGKKEAGTERLQDLINRYPTSPEASRAKTFLKPS